LRSRILILSGVLVGLLVIAAGAIYAYDQSRKDVIGQGVRAGGVSLQGLTRAQARAKLDRLIMEPLARPIVVHHDKSTWTLGPREARIAVDLDAIVDDAMARSRGGDIFSRTVRNLTGKSLDADLQPTVRYSDRAVVRMLDKIRGAIDRPARDAAVKITAAGVDQRSSRTGLAVRASDLHRKIRRALVSTTADRTMVARTRKIQPKVSTSDLDERYRTVLIINRNSFQLTLYKKLRVEKTFRIAVGKVGLETPAGLYNIQNKAINPAWHVPKRDWAGDLAGKVIPGDDPSNPLKARWMGIYDGAGIHGTDADGSIGTAASHGCIRMRIPDVIELYDEVPVGAPVYIA
jgi:lipoprotein-anchoring transpeptidase ErfK/SrfK